MTLTVLELLGNNYLLGGQLTKSENRVGARFDEQFDDMKVDIKALVQRQNELERLGEDSRGLREQQ